MSAKRSPSRPSSNRTRRAARKRSRGAWWIVGAVALVVVVALVAALTASGGDTSSRSPASPALIEKVTSVPAAVFGTVGTGSATSAPKTIDAPPLTADGKPLVLYIGAEYCPFCAAERWAMVVALSRFGSFAGLQTTKSAGNDAFPNTPTFSFHGATYESKYLTLQGVELRTRTGEPLDTPTSEQQRLFSTYDAPPYTPQAGTIPFIDFGGKYLINGATYDAGVLAGKSTEEIATALSDPSTDVSRAVVGAANTMTAAVCTLTRNAPVNVCTDPAIARIQTNLK